MRGIIKERKSQAISEYFLVLMLIAALTIIGSTTIFSKAKTAGESFFNTKISSIPGTAPLAEE